MHVSVGSGRFTASATTGEAGLDMTGSGNAMGLLARAAGLLVGEWPASFLVVRVGEAEDGREGPAQDFLAKERNVPATERLKLLERSDVSAVLRLSLAVSSSSSGERENLLAVETFRFIFLEVRRKTSILAR